MAKIGFGDLEGGLSDLLESFANDPTSQETATEIGKIRFELKK